MRVQYLKDTDTALIELGKRPVVETREVGEDVYLDLDENGRIVAITIEHARDQAKFPELVYQQVE
jgi:uncharacterized protein YuzE